MKRGLGQNTLAVPATQAACLAADMCWNTNTAGQSFCQMAPAWGCNGPNVVPLPQLNSTDIAHDVFVVGAMSIPVILLMTDHPLLALLVGGFEYALFYSLGGPRINL